MSARFRVLIAAVLTAFICCGCAHNSDRYLPVHTSTPRISTLGFSVRPPPGRGWYERVNRDTLFYFKKIDSDTYSIATRATELHFSQEFPGINDFLDHVKTRKLIGGDSILISNVRLTLSVSAKSQRCVRYRQRYEDHRPEGPSGGLAAPPFTIVSNTGLVCAHPDNDRLGIDLFYQERQASDKPAQSFANEGESFLSSLSFLTLAAQR